MCRLSKAASCWTTWGPLKNPLFTDTETINEATRDVVSLQRKQVDNDWLRNPKELDGLQPRERNQKLFCLCKLEVQTQPCVLVLRPILLSNSVMMGIAQNSLVVSAK